MKWIKEPIVLQGNYVSLLPLEQSHFDELIEISKDDRIWQHYIYDCSDISKLTFHLNSALIDRETGTQYPFVVLQRKDNKIIGSTRFLDLQPAHLKLEIGWTWLHPDSWATQVNLECKFLLLSHCFEKMNTRRVQLKTDENNQRSRKAIEKIGGKFEGIFRNDMVRENGTNRNSAYFSIIDSDWINVKKNLEDRLSV